MKSIWHFPVSLGLFISLSACSPDADKPQGKIVGPDGKDVTQRPINDPSPGSILLKGCCSFDPGEHELEELFGENQAWRVTGEAFELVFDYGSSFDPPAEMSGSLSETIDGIEVQRMALDPGRAPATVLAARLEASNHNNLEIVDPTLSVKGSCPTEAGCNAAREVLGSLRF